MTTTAKSRLSRKAVLLLGAAVLALAPVTAACATASADTSVDSGADSSGADRHQNQNPLLAARHLTTLSQQDVVAALRTAQFDPGVAKYGVDTYQLVYRTSDERGQSTVASGLLVLPANGERELRPVSFTHGTTSYKFDAPSMKQPSDFAVAPVLSYGAAGFAAVAPDYLGLGISPGPHPWMDVPTETTASLDMLRAARGFVTGQGRKLDREVMVTGFSQGASAALGLARDLQAGRAPEFRLGALAPVSGAYDFQHAELPALLNGELEPKSSALYAAYLLVSWNRLHHLYDSPSEMFQAPYDATIEHLFDSTAPGRDLMTGTPARVDQLLTPRALELLRNPDGPLAAALRVSDSVCTDWAPRVPTRLYVMAGDEQAVDTNTEHCRSGLRANGVDPQVVTVGPGEYQGSRHLGSNALATPSIVEWFVQLAG
ncbi:alpha/beta hydrolase family protein [Goodfellowiella coeruleoviolacea]|uniref:Alpha/beta hydrolase family protein n=1 Tax=Goodfellowiella coeruleoviolacea TaxID=334858 RepID=A0AAE3GIQ5_9PSEU|nr:lipase family protein [Goodfellowiella coeruleoviolacea]MCP2168089.1 Alpha/beta hydrolase family protein [Goodfellowiella coeruleoviolacea]